MGTTAKDAKGYLAKKEVSQLFESLLTGLLYNQPANHVKFLQDCLQRIEDENLTSITWNTFIDATKSEMGPTTLPEKCEPLPPIKSEAQKTSSSLDATSEPKIPIVLLSGGPGSGKTTQGQLLADRHAGWVLISKQELLQQTNALSRLSQRELAIRKQLVREMAVDTAGIAVAAAAFLISRAIQSGVAGILIENYPATLAQLRDWNKEIGRLDLCILLDVDELELRTRSLKSGEISKELFGSQLKFYRQQTVRVVQNLNNMKRIYYIDGEKSVDVVYVETSAVLECAFYRTRDSDGSMQSNFDEALLSEPIGEPLGPLKSSSAYGQDDWAIEPQMKVQHIMLQNEDCGRQPGLPQCPIIFILGGPGSGKGLQCKRLMARYKNVVHLRARELARSLALQQAHDSAADTWHTLAKLLMQGEIISVV